MNLIIFSNMAYLPAELSHKLIPQGVSIFNGALLNELSRSKGLRYHTCLIDETCYNKKEILTIVTQIRKNDLKKGKKIILLSTMNDAESIRIFTIMGFDYVIPRSLSVESITNRIHSFIKKNTFETDQRKFFRFKIHDQETAFLNLFGPSKITDISMGGIAVNLMNTANKKLEENKTYSKTQILLENKSIFADLKLIKADILQNQINTGTAIFQFQNLDETSKNSLAEYIFYKTQETFSHAVN